MAFEEKTFDKASSQILQILQADARIGNQQLAERVGLSVTPVWRRVRELEDAGVIRSYVALLDRQKMGLHLCVLVYISLSRHNVGVEKNFETMVKTSPEIMDCLAMAGDSDYVIKVVVRDIAAYNHFLQKNIFRLEGIAHVRSQVVLREVKADTALPIL
jgi:Lrp/AsnC family transcriptional regulator, leucine-responsive regulatory protein